jgi:16S rRNA (uracil1498-N3)-methyltransferase
MRVSRLYVNLPLTPNQTVELQEAGTHYLRNVLRLTKGSALVLFNGDGREYDAVVLEASRFRVSLHIDKARLRDAESPLAVVLGLSISRSDRMDWALQKSVELGARHITPLLTERCVVQLKGDKRDQKTAHWQKIVQHAAEQCGRTLLPVLEAVQDLATWSARQQGLKIILDPYATIGLRQLQPQDDTVTLLAGPEGGFSEWERQTAQAAGFHPVCLGSRILRTETASLTALAAVQTLWGDLGMPVSVAAAETGLED